MLTSTHRLYDVLDVSGEAPRRIGRLSFPLMNESRTGMVQGLSGALALPLFQYDPEWLKNGFSLGFDLPLTQELLHPMPGEMNFLFMREREVNDEVLALLEMVAPDGFPADASPVERRSAIAPQPPRSQGAVVLSPVDPVPPLEPVSDNPAEGFGRFTEPLQRIPVFERLVYAWQLHARGKGSAKELKVLAKSCGLPGRRINPVIQKDGREVVLRLRAPGEMTDSAFWKTFALHMAARAGIQCVKSEVMRSRGDTVSVSERFDRRKSDQSPRFALSATSLATRRLNAGRPGPVSYLGMADILNREGAAPKADLSEMFSRILYTTIVGSGRDTPDRWQFLRTELGWRLAPAHSLEWASPDMMSMRPSITLDGRRPVTSAESLVLSAPYFALTPSEAKLMLADMLRRLSQWETFAIEEEADPNDMALMGRVFEQY